MNIKDEKLLMTEAATLYYKDKHTQQEIANIMGLSRQTVSKLLNDALKENIVEIKINNPKNDCENLQKSICNTFGIKSCIVSSVSSNNEALRKLMTITAATKYITDIIIKGNNKIALSWGRTIQELITALPKINATGNIVFPLFGATDNVNSYFSSNELVRSLADKISAEAKYAWFPYLPDSAKDQSLLKNLSYYKKTEQLWSNADIAILGIGNSEMLNVFAKDFGYRENHYDIIGDIATHFFNQEGQFVDLYKNTLCASISDIKKAKQTIAIAFGDNKAKAIAGALRTKIISTLITDEYTARKILEN